MEKIMENKSQTKVLGVVVVAVGLLWFGVQDASSDPIDSLLGDTGVRST